MEKDCVVLEETSLEEEVSALSQICVATKSFEWVKEETLVVAIRCDQGEHIEKLSTIEICGKQMIDWVLLATSGCQQKVISDCSDSELVETLKNLKTDKKYVFVIYSDLPFLQNKTFNEIMYCFATNNLNSLKLPRGYVFKSEFLPNLTDLNLSVKKSFGQLDFERVDNADMISKFFKMMSDKIKSYHRNSGVVLLGQETIFIDADVEIEAGAIIYPNNILKGQTYIGKNVVLESGNVIDDSIISDDCLILSSYISKSKVKNGQSIGPFAKLENESV